MSKFSRGTWLYWHPWSRLICVLHTFKSRLSAPTFSQSFAQPRRSSNSALCVTTTSSSPSAASVPALLPSPHTRSCASARRTPAPPVCFADAVAIAIAAATVAAATVAAAAVAAAPSRVGRACPPPPPRLGWAGDRRRRLSRGSWRHGRRMVSALSPTTRRPYGKNFLDIQPL